MSNVIETHSLGKIYGTEQAVRDLDWQVEQGTAVAFLGPNGAGKTTTIKMLLGFTHPSRGSCEVFGAEPWNMPPETRMRIGYVPDEPCLPTFGTAGSILDYHRTLYPCWDRKLERELIELFQLSLKKQISKLSKGQARRVAIVLALCQGSELLLLDEPTAGLDVAARRELLGLLTGWLADGDRSLVFSTHLVGDVERIATHASFMQRGRLVASDELEALKADVKRIRMTREIWDRTRPSWEQTELLSSEVDEHRAVLCVREFRTQSSAVLAPYASAMVESTLTADSDMSSSAIDQAIDVVHLSLEDIYLELTSNNARNVEPCRA